MKVRFGLSSHCLMFCGVPLLRLSTAEMLFPLFELGSLWPLLVYEG